MDSSNDINAVNHQAQQVLRESAANQEYQFLKRLIRELAQEAT